MSEVLAPVERDSLYRSAPRDVELRAEGDGNDAPVMTGHFAVFNEWTEIDSMWEGNFLERFAPGSFKKTFSENRQSIRPLFQHGFDPTIGDKPLGPVEELREDNIGGYYEVPLLDAGYVRNEVLPGLEAGLYGCSFRFRVVREEINEEPGISTHNPKGLPERTVTEAKVSEFGPVTFPYYPSATAGIRSLSDEMIALRFKKDPDRLDQLLENVSRDQSTVTEPVDAAAKAGDTDEPETSPDRAAEEAPEEEAPDSGEEESPAPPEEADEPEAQTDDGRRAMSEPLFGSTPSTPTWRL